MQSLVLVIARVPTSWSFFVFWLLKPSPFPILTCKKPMLTPSSLFKRLVFRIINYRDQAVDENESGQCQASCCVTRTVPQWWGRSRLSSSKDTFEANHQRVKSHRMLGKANLNRNGTEPQPSKTITKNILSLSWHGTFLYACSNWSHQRELTYAGSKSLLSALLSTNWRRPSSHMLLDNAQPKACCRQCSSLPQGSR